MRAGPHGLAALLAVALALGALSAGPAAAAHRASTLAGYSFEDDVDTGPDTFAIWRGARGHVVLSRAFHQSGGRSVELRDIRGDGDFPELQGYFPARRTGWLYFHFALLLTDPAEELNVALAGPRFFDLEKDGIAFWLATREGFLVHVSDSIPRKLFRPEPFVWYAVDVAYAVLPGQYALRIRREGDPEPVVDVRGQANASSHPGSAVDKFSFVGAPYGDGSNVTYYVDDVVVGTDETILATPFAAPGRRKLFVEQFLELERRMGEEPRCVPASALGDFGFVEAGAGDPDDADLAGLLEGVLTGRADPEGVAARTGDRRAEAADAVDRWNEGCAALGRGDARAALAAFDDALRRWPRGQIFALSRAVALVALVALGRTAEADDQLLEVAAGWRDDPRYAVVSAWAGLRRGDLEHAEDVLHDPALLVLDGDANPPSELLPEQYFHVQVWQGRYALARDYARAVAERLAGAGLRHGLWLERSGDAAFLERDLDLARELYEQAREDASRRAWADLKLADVAFLTGDLDRERVLRERYHGALRE